MSSSVTFEPSTDRELTDALAEIHAAGDAVEVRGGGSVLDRLPQRDTPTLSTRALAGIVAHAATDLTITVRAGTPVSELARALAAHGQECPIEPAAGAGSTVGGRVATALAGPRQLGAGRVRGQILRVRFVTSEGTTRTAGGVTVKDVTGFDLCRLMTGSWGTIGVIAEVTLKVRPIATHAAWYVSERPRTGLSLQLYRPSAVFVTPEHTHVLLEGHPSDVAEQAAAADLHPGSPPSLPTTARASVDPARLSELGETLTALGIGVTMQEGVGVAYLDAPAGGLAAARAEVAGLGGSLLVLDPDAGLPAFGSPLPTDADSAMSTRVTEALDPGNILAPWRWHR